MDLNKDLENLKKHIIPLSFKPCEKKDGRILCDIIDLRYKNDLDAVCACYDVTLMVKRDPEYKCFFGGGYICMQMDHVITELDICVIFSHELAHRIQGFSGSKLCKWQTFEERLTYERQAARFAYFVYKAYFRHLMKLTHRNFVYYKSKSDINFLREKHFEVYDK